MPHRSRKTHNWLALIGGAFAFLLIVSSLLISKQQAGEPDSVQTNSSVPTPTGDGLVAGASQDRATTQNQDSAQASIDTSNWKNYRDPLYHFEIKYPAEWASPVAKRINDPDFDYEYQVLFGTADTIAGDGIEGFTIFVYPTNKCNATGASGQPKCATTKSKSAVESDSQQNIFEFSSKVYTYTIVPFVPDPSTDSILVQKTKLELNEAQKTFVLDPNLQLVPKPQNQPNAKSLPPVQAPKPVPAPRIGRSGKLTGAVRSGGKLVCPHPNRKPMRSPNKGNHVDEDCCPDPDEWPNIACSYKPSDYAIMLKP
jgi:hypothetical protein